MAAPMKKMADEICGSLELMRGEGIGGEARGRGEGRGSESFVSEFAVANKGIKERYYTAAYLFILSVGGGG